MHTQHECIMYVLWCIYNLGLIRTVCCVFISHKIRAAMDLLPMADEKHVGLANCDYSFAEIWRGFLILKK